MSTTVGPSTAVITEPEAGPALLIVHLVDDSVVQLETRGWNCDVLIESIFRRGHFKASDGVYYSAGQIKKIVAK